MSALKDQVNAAIHWADRCKEILGKDVIAPDERVELETLCAIAIELIKSASPSKLRDAGRIVELRYRMKNENIQSRSINQLRDCRHGINK